MKCLCGYSHRPDNLDVLKQHATECMSEGALSRRSVNPAVVFRDGELLVVLEVNPGESVLATYKNPKEGSSDFVVKAENKPAPKKRASRKKATTTDQ